MGAIVSPTGQRFSTDWIARLTLCELRHWLDISLIFSRRADTNAQLNHPNDVTRRMLGRTWIDSNRCERGIEALRQYRREYDDKLKDWRRNPLHDWTSHGADAPRPGVPHGYMAESSAGSGGSVWSSNTPGRSSH
jgi:hypothetical protein